MFLHLCQWQVTVTKFVPYYTNIFQHTCASATLRIASLSTLVLENHSITDIESILRKRESRSLGFWLGGFHIEYSPSPIKFFCLINYRLYLLAAAGIAETEKELLGMFDDQMRTYERSRRHSNAVILGLCLRRLSLKYRCLLSHCRALAGGFLHLPS